MKTKHQQSPEPGQEWEKIIYIKLFNVLNDYGDFFLTDYPSQAETKSIHPTINRIISLIASERQRVFEQTVEKMREDYQPFDKRERMFFREYLDSLLATGLDGVHDIDVTHK